LCGFTRIAIQHVLLGCLVSYRAEALTQTFCLLRSVRRHELRSAFTVEAWNKASDEELHSVESLARDGLRLANAQLLAFALVAICSIYAVHRGDETGVGIIS
jgi:hypothetical protein